MFTMQYDMKLKKFRHQYKNWDFIVIYFNSINILSNVSVIETLNRFTQ